MVMQWKPIIPPPIKEGEIFNSVEDALDSVASAIVEQFKEFTDTWEHKPVFIVEGKKGYRIVYANDEPLFYVNFGTEPHRIPKAAPGPLVFQWGGPGSYKAKTSPGKVKSSAGGSSGPIVVFRSVQHPGIEARHIDEAIVKNIQKIIQKSTQAIILKGVERAGLR